MSEIRIEGTVEAKKCKCCGHHEIGISWISIDRQGLQWPGYRQLRPGDKIVLIMEGPGENSKSSLPKEAVGG